MHRQSHKPGEGVVDYAGLTLPVVEPPTGEVRGAQIFFDRLAASSCIFADGQWAQDLHNWLAGHVRAFEALGGGSTSNDE